MCKFCGFFQNVGEDSKYLLPNAHPCAKADAHRILGELYIQWAQPNDVTRKCEFCGREYSVSSCAAPRPWATGEHGWWQIPQGMDRDQSIAFWKDQGINKGSPYL